MFSYIAELTGKIIGETAHQTKELAVGTSNILSDTFDDVCNMPSAFSKGYDEELFESTPEQTKEEPSSKPYVEPVA